MPIMVFLMNTFLTFRDFVELSNQFYTLIPHAAKVSQKLPLINDVDILKQKNYLLEVCFSFLSFSSPSFF